MGLFDIFKSRKRKQEGPTGAETEDLVRLDGAALAELTPPETRYTQEYRDYLAAQEAAGAGEAPSGDEQ